MMTMAVGTAMVVLRIIPTGSAIAPSEGEPSGGNARSGPGAQCNQTADSIQNGAGLLRKRKCAQCRAPGNPNHSMDGACAC